MEEVRAAVVCCCHGSASEEINDKKKIDVCVCKRKSEIEREKYLLYGVLVRL